MLRYRTNIGVSGREALRLSVLPLQPRLSVVFTAEMCGTDTRRSAHDPSRVVDLSHERKHLPTPPVVWI